MPNLSPLILVLITNLRLSLSKHGGCSLKSTLEIPMLSKPMGLLYVNDELERFKNRLGANMEQF